MSIFSRRTPRTPVFEGLEQLEARQLLSTVHWTGNGDGTSLLDRHNWECNHLPNLCDTAIIDVEANPSITLTHGLFAVRKLVLAEELTVTGGAMFIGSGGTNITESGTFNLDGGCFTGCGRLTDNGHLNWTAGLLAGIGIIDVTPTGTFNLGSDSDPLDLRRDLLNRGVMNWTGGDIDGHDACGNIIVNVPGAVFHASGEGRFRSLCGPGLIDNKGTLVREGEGFTRLAVRFDSCGVVNVAGGTLQIVAGGLNSGARNVGAEGTLHYVGDYTHAAGSTLAGGGQTIWTGGVNTLSGDWTVAGRLFLVNTTVTGPGAWTIDGRLAWSHGRIEGDAGLVVGPTGKMSINTEGQHTLARDVDNQGVMVWNKGALTFEGATITNQLDRLFFVSANTTAVAGEGGGSIVNHGELRKVLSTDLDLGGVLLDNDGLVFAKNGLLNAPTVAQLADSTLSAGAWRVFPSGNLGFGDAAIHTVGAAASITRVGRSAGLAALDNLARNDGTISIFGGGAFTVAPDGGVLTNAGNLIMNDSTALDVQGDFEQTETGNLTIGISYAATMASGRLVSANNATLNGNVVVSLQNGYDPVPGAQFFFLSATSVQGQFVGLDSGNGDPATLEYRPDGVMLIYV